MNMQMKEGFAALTEKEKQTLRLVVRGHDAKSLARNLGLSVHTINERLRDARRKMAVSSSREAARLLLAAEGDDASAPNPYSLGDMEIGADAGRPQGDQDSTPIDGVGRAHRNPLIIIGALLMTLILGLLALTAMPNAAPAPQPTLQPASATAQETVNQEVVAAASQWLALLDQGNWDASYQATGSAFRTLNSLQVWSKVSEEVRTPLGAMVSRTFLSQENLPAPPAGYEVVKFRTRFANKTEAIETVTLDRENGGWHVVGVTIG